MPKIKKKFPIQDTNSNGNFIAITNYYYNNFSVCKKLDESISEAHETQLASDGFYNEVITSSFDAFRSEIIKSINTQNVIYLEELLKLDFVYESSKRVWTEDNNILKPRLFYQSGVVRPILEAFFYDQVDAFVEIVLALINKNSEELYLCFNQAIQMTELYSKDLFEWNDAIKTETLTLLFELLKHAEKIGGKNKNDLSIEKGSRLYGMADSIIQDVQMHAAAQSDTFRKRFQNLHYKLTIKNSMHEDEELLAQHHGKIQRGLLSLSRNKPNSQNYVNIGKSHHSLFVPKTKSQKQVEKVEAVLFPKVKLH